MLSGFYQPGEILIRFHSLLPPPTPVNVYLHSQVCESSKRKPCVFVYSRKKKTPKDNTVQDFFLPSPSTLYGHYGEKKKLGDSISWGTSPQNKKLSGMEWVCSVYYCGGERTFAEIDSFSLCRVERQVVRTRSAYEFWKLLPNWLRVLLLGRSKVT